MMCKRSKRSSLIMSVVHSKRQKRNKWNGFVKIFSPFFKSKIQQHLVFFQFSIPVNIKHQEKAIVLPGSFQKARLKSLGVPEKDIISTARFLDPLKKCQRFKNCLNN